MPDFKSWIAAAKILATDPTAKVPCPECGSADLYVQDAPTAAGKVERHLSCPDCGAYNAILHPIKSLREGSEK